MNKSTFPHLPKMINAAGAFVVFVLLFMVPAQLAAQTEQEKADEARRAAAAVQKRVAAMKAALSAPTPHLADGHPDLSGIWGDQGFGIVSKDAEGIHVISPQREAPKSVDPEGKLVRYYDQADGDKRRALNPNKPPYKDEWIAKVRQLDKEENQIDPVVSCHPSGVPRAGVPTQIFATSDYLVFFYTGENSSHYRLIPTNVSTHPSGASPSYFGDSIAHWEGDTLLVDVTSFNDQTWLGSDGWFHTDALHVVERFSREGNVLHYQATVEDPNVLTRPWVGAPRTVLLMPNQHDYVFEELPCRDFDHEHIVNHDHF